MPSAFSENLRIYNAEQFRASISELGPTNVYLTVGRVSPWANDSAPPQANSSVTTFNTIWDNMLGAKLLVGNDVRHAVPRHDWTANTTYAAYDHCTCSLLLFDENVKFFVVTSDWNVYKCLANNNGGVSNTMPTQTITNAAVEEQDGYIWKYMYTLTSEERIRFMTDDFIPVKTLTIDNNSLQWQVQQEAIPGSIDAIKVTNSGFGYINANSVVVTVTGDGSDATAVARVAGSQITSIIMTNPGKDYTYADITITGTGGGSNAAARAIISPPGGHGADAMRELGGSYLVLNPRLKNSETNKIPINNEYREIALIQDPISVSTGNIATNTVYSQVQTLTMSTGIANYVLDEYVYQGPSLSSYTFRGIVADWDSDNNVLKLTNTDGVISTAALIGANSTTARYVESSVDRELKKYSGNLLYIDYNTPIERAEDQTEDFKMVLKF